jgi:hypothetical protein
VFPGQRKLKWQENPPPLKACRFDSDLGQSNGACATANGERSILLKALLVAAAGEADSA